MLALVAVPRSAGRTEFCTARTRTGITMPMPAPRTAIQMLYWSRGVSASSRESSHMPTAARTLPRIGHIRYRPVWLMSCPAMIEAPTIPAIMGSISSPDSVAEAPSTIWRKVGR
ncbi:hypothetical protein SAV14893_010520 [Streptomyces avermitilis]|uniref:Uncharacterized protein n=1 Tax=Streptomyces avermitilis TaxID=33903 RepID=A0A4D4LV40_STRAX|nr:hypothetical protein SAV14893_010520 [Streptomyces avermitilis]